MTKPAFFLTLTAAACFIACDQPRKVVSVKASFDYKKGESFYDKNNDSAFYYFNKVVTGSGDSLEIALAYSYMGIIQSGAGDYYGSQESLLQSLKQLDKQKITDRECLLSDFNELGRVSLNLKNYSAATAYYDKALQFIEDDNARIIVLSNKAVACQKMKQYGQALLMYDSILEKSKSDTKRYARILSNMAFTKWLQDSNYQAAPDLLQALHIQEKEKDNRRLNASYAHLADYYFHSRPDSALGYANKMYVIAKQLNSPDDELEALQKMIALNPPGAVKKYFARYQYLTDSIQTSRNNAKNQFALIRYDVEKSKADNLSLQKDNAENKIQILFQWIFLFGAIVTAVIIFLWYRRRRRRMLEEQRLKTSQKVHDVVANGLYQLMAKIEYEEPAKEIILDDLEQLYEQSRDISYDQPEAISANYYDSIAALLSSFSTAHTNIAIVGNTEDTWKGIQPKIKSELKYVLKELMVNMKKHSAANNVVMRFEQRNNILHIRYTDDGNGLPPDFCYKNGLRSTENRISGMGGDISFDTSTATGLKIQLYIPIA